MDALAVQRLLKDVQIDGMVLIDQRKLLFLLGRQYETASVWAELLNQWKEIGGQTNELYGGWIEGSNLILLGTKKISVEPVKDWA